MATSLVQPSGSKPSGSNDCGLVVDMAVSDKQLLATSLVPSGSDDGGLLDMAASDKQLLATSLVPSESDNRGLVCGHVSMIGRREDMEDTVTMLVHKKYSFFAVYDGHGGTKVAEECRDKMHKFVDENVEREIKLSKEGVIDWKKVMVESFRCMDAEIDLNLKLKQSESEEMTEESKSKDKSKVGSTATVVLVGKNEMVVANCGDSRAVLSRGGVVVPLSRDHKPDRTDERERIEAAGGLVINWNGWRVQGLLSTSRSLGDEFLKPYVSSEPEVSVMKRSELDEFLIIGTDGLFDVVCNEFACDFTKQHLNRQLRRRKAKESRVSAQRTKAKEESQVSARKQRRKPKEKSQVSEQRKPNEGSQVSEQRKANERSQVSAIATMLANHAFNKGSNDNISIIIVHMK